MSSNTLDSRLKKIRKELSLIDDDLKSLTKAVSSSPGSRVDPSRLKSRRLAEKAEPVSGRPSVQVEPKKEHAAASRRVVKKDDVSAPASRQKKGDERFLEYLSSSFNSGLPLRQERRLQRNKAIVMLVVVLFFLFLLLYRMLM